MVFGSEQHHPSSFCYFNNTLSSLQVTMVLRRVFSVRNVKLANYMKSSWWVLSEMISSMSGSSQDTHFHLRAMALNILQMVVVGFRAHNYTQFIVNLGKALSAEKKKNLFSKPNHISSLWRTTATWILVEDVSLGKGNPRGLRASWPSSPSSP